MKTYSTWNSTLAHLQLLTSGCGGDRCGLLATFEQGVQGDDIFRVGLKAC